MLIIHMKIMNFDFCLFLDLILKQYLRLFIRRTKTKNLQINIGSLFILNFNFLYYFIGIIASYTIIITQTGLMSSF